MLVSRLCIGLIENIKIALRLKVGPKRILKIRIGGRNAQMRKWTRKRSSRLIRAKNGRFKKWRGGRTKSQLKKKRNTFQGIAIHIGKEYKRQHGQPARVGSIVRTKRKDGGYHRGADWYVKTRHGWRDSGSPTKPTRAKIKRICARARTGR